MAAPDDRQDKGAEMTNEELERIAQPYESRASVGQDDEYDVLLGWWFDNADELLAFAQAILAHKPVPLSGDGDSA